VDQLDFLVQRENLSQVRWDYAPTRDEYHLAEGDALLEVDRYAFSANNITYAVCGEALQYWQFFPAPEGWGRIPVWGYANVVASRASELQEGTRVFGYLPMSPYLKVHPMGVSGHSFADASEHRRQLPATYQSYERVQPGDARTEELRAILRPLMGTGYLIDAWLHDQAQFGARQILVASASSKTAIGAAYFMSRRPQRDFEIVGLTSSRNRAFCERLGYYDRVVEYGQISALDAAVPAVFVDMAGDAQVTAGIHGHFAAALKHSCLVGLTHRTVSLGAPARDLPGPAPQLFFAPAQLELQQKQWGVEGFATRVREAQRDLYAAADEWLRIAHARGREPIEAAYRAVLEGRVEPSQGLILAL
jgi:hypothetical protein